jgi:hypothetical protein
MTGTFIPNFPTGLRDRLSDEYGVDVSPEDALAYVLGVMDTGAYAGEVWR